MAVPMSMVTMYLSESEERSCSIETVRATLRTLARRAGKRYAQAKNEAGRVVATVSVEV